jgi:parallel beta-helix repeat protein
MSILRKLSTKVFTLSLLIAAFACTPALADPIIQITQCGTVITQPGHYILANDLSCGGPSPGAPVQGATPLNPFDGIEIVADHVTLLLDGHTITGDGGDGAGITVGVGVPSGNSHVSIVGPGTITAFQVGVLFEQVSHSSVADMKSVGNEFGFAVNGGFSAGCGQACPSTMNTFQGNSADFNSQHGFTLNGANHNTFRSNDASNNAAIGIFLFTAAHNDVRDNTANSNAVGIAITAGRLVW